MKKVPVTPREKLHFWEGIAIGLATGIISNLTITSAFEIVHNGWNLYSGAMFSISAFIVICILFYLSSKIKKLIKEK